MKKLLSPRGYLSHTQIDLWRRNHARYIEQYVYGAPGFNSRRMDFGSKTAKALETGEETDDDMINMLVTLLPRYDVNDKEMRATLRSKHGEVVLLGKPDSYCSKTHAIQEDKTGTTPWTQGRANKHNQLDQYATMVWLNHNVLSQKITLNWAETQVDPNTGDVSLTGRIKHFEVKKTMQDVLSYMALVTQVAREIDEAYRKELDKLA